MIVGGLNVIKLKVNLKIKNKTLAFLI